MAAAAAAAQALPPQPPMASKSTVITEMRATSHQWRTIQSPAPRNNRVLGLPNVRPKIISALDTATIQETERNRRSTVVSWRKDAICIHLFSGYGYTFLGPHQFPL